MAMLSIACHMSDQLPASLPFPGCQVLTSSHRPPETLGAVVLELGPTANPLLASQDNLGVKGICA